MKKLSEMNLVEAEAAYSNALRNLPHDTHMKIVKNSAANKNDSPQYSHTKEAFRRVNQLSASV